jgi:hypothetical protein
MAGPSPTTPTAVTDCQASRPINRLIPATAACSTWGRVRDPSHHSTAPPPRPTAASTDSSGTDVSAVIGRTAPNRQRTPLTP